MQNDFIERVNKANKQAFDTAKQIAELNASTFESVLTKQLTLANELATINARQAKIIAEYQDAPSAIEAQSALIQEIAEQAAGAARDTVELMSKTRAEYDELFQKSLKEAGDAVAEAQAAYGAAA